MSRLNFKNFLILLFHAFIIWALCGMTISIGRSITTIEMTLLIHLIAAPVITMLVSIVYFKKYNFTPPMITATIFLTFVVIMDAGIVAPFFEKSYAMFQSLIGTWIPFVLIFISAYFTGIIINRKEKSK